MNRPSYPHTLPFGLPRADAGSDFEAEPDWEALKAQAEAASFEEAARSLREDQHALAHDPFGAPQGTSHVGEGAPMFDAFEPAPTFATPSLVPGPSAGAGYSFDEDDEIPSFAAKGRPKWLVPVGAALAVVALFIGGNFALKQQAAEAEREALRERMRQEMARAASAPKVEEPTALPTSAPSALPTSGSVASMLAKSVASNGASGVSATAAIAPRGKQHARPARAVQSRARYAKPSRNNVRRAGPQRDVGDGIPENSSNDPLLGL